MSLMAVGSFREADVWEWISKRTAEPSSATALNESYHMRILEPSVREQSCPSWRRAGEWKNAEIRLATSCKDYTSYPIAVHPLLASQAATLCFQDETISRYQ